MTGTKAPADASWDSAANAITSNAQINAGRLTDNTSQEEQLPMSESEMLERVRELDRQGKLPSIEKDLKAWDEVSAILRPQILAERRRQK